MAFRFAVLFYCLVTVLLAANSAAAETVGSLPKSITLSYESLLPGNPSIKPLATIFYDPSTLKSTLSSWTPPSLNLAKPIDIGTTSPQLLRILLPSGSSTLTSLNTFNSSLSQIIDLQLSPQGDGAIFSASVFASTPLPDPSTKAKSTSKSKSKNKVKSQAKVQQETEASANVKVNIVPPTAGPSPKLVSRKPSVIGADGKEQPTEEVEKSLFQKYWWVFLVVALFAMSGGGKD